MSCHFYFSIDTLLAKIYYIAKGSYGLKKQIRIRIPFVSVSLRVLQQSIGDLMAPFSDKPWLLQQIRIQKCSMPSFFQRLRFQARQGKGLAQISGESVSILFRVPGGISRDDFETLP